MTKIGLALQGGGAIGAYQAGVIEALIEKKAQPVVVSGASIGAANAAALCGHRGDDPMKAIRGLWDDLSMPDMLLPEIMFPDGISSLVNPNMYMPRPDFWQPWAWNGYYDTSPFLLTLKRHIDFSRLKEAPSRLLVSATNIASGNLEVFDSLHMPIAADHVAASCSLPPSFSPTKAPDAKGETQTYWDAGIFDNSPLRHIINRLAENHDTLDVLMVVNLFPQKGKVPTNMFETFGRMFEILFGHKLVSDNKLIHQEQLLVDYREKIRLALSEVDKHLPEEAVSARKAVDDVKEHPAFKLLSQWFSVVDKIVEVEYTESEPSCGMMDFSSSAIERRWKAGYKDGLAAIGRMEEMKKQE